MSEGVERLSVRLREERGRATLRGLVGLPRERVGFNAVWFEGGSMIRPPERKEAIA